jgi:two-component system, cell cycle response regulator DivK
MTKVLIVDDTSQVRMLVGRYLQAKGYEISEAENGEEGVVAAIADRPDLILMDLNMPVMDGFKATQEIKSKPTLKDVPIIALTAEADTESRQAIYEAGCDAFVSKPIDFKLLMTKIEAQVI